MFRTITLRGTAATVTWGYRTAAVLRAWTVRKNADGQWSLHAGIDRCDPFQLQQRPLRFTAPRKGGFFVFPVTAITVGVDHVTARLGHPEY